MFYQTVGYKDCTNGANGIYSRPPLLLW